MKMLAVVLSSMLLAMNNACRAGTNDADRGPVRHAARAGQFYPADPKVLAEVVDKMLANVRIIAPDGGAVAFMAPHAGYIYSAQTAAHVYKILAGKPVKNVILIGNSHNFRLSKGAVFVRGSFATPLGEVPVNDTLAMKILSLTPLLEENTDAHAPEHSLEVQLPFLQRVLKNARIVPILLGSQSMDQCRAIGEGIADAVKALGLEKETVIIESTDAAHYPAYDDAKRVEGAAIKTLEQMDPPALQRTIAALMESKVPNMVCVFCGEESLYATIYAARRLGATAAKILAHANSGDVKVGDRSRVVGYVAAAFFRESARAGAEKEAVMQAANKSEDKSFSVSAENQAELLRTARQAIEYYLAAGKRKVFTAAAELKIPAAVFVTLTTNGILRGCIGTTEPRMPLIEAVGYFAVAAAVEDRRFPRVTPEELGGIHIEISVLSPMTKVKSADEIKPKVHGVVVRRGWNSGLFLPQVWEHFTRKEDFLDELCSQKAGLEPGAWKNPETDLRVFTVFAFEEKR